MHFVRYHKGYPEKYWKFLYLLDAFLFFLAICFLLSLVVEYGTPLTPMTKKFLGWFNIFILVILLLEPFIKFILSSSKSYFLSDEYFEIIMTALLGTVVLYVGYLHLYTLSLPFHVTSLVHPRYLHWMALKTILLISMLSRFKEFNRILLGLKIKPVQLLVGGFFMVIVLGTLLLHLPTATVGGISTLDALFMSTSATTVTGLVTLQPGTDFTFIGQIILILLMQVGGLGIMTLGAFVALILRGNFGIEGRYIMSESIETKVQHELYSLLKQIVRFSLLMEGIGAVIFTWRFHLRFHDISKSLFYGIFHAVSGFCNAGLSVFTDNLSGFQKDPYVVLMMATLIITGGIGFLVISDINKYISKRQKDSPRRHLSMQTKIVLSVTAFLLIGGTILIYFTEYHNQLSHLSFPYQLLNAFFQAVTPRTAGFNTLDIGHLNQATLLTLMALMVIGGGSGSTAGGIKVNTLGLLFGLWRATIFGKKNVTIFERTIPQTTINKAIAVTFFAMIITVVGTLFILINDHFAFLDTIFEAISAFNTVGLSTGITPQVGANTKIILSLLMFMGRVGPLSLVIALAQREKEEKFIDYPEEDILVG